MPQQATTRLQNIQARKSRRKQLVHAVVSGLRVQAAVAAAAAACVLLSGTPVQKLSGNALVYTSLAVALIPAWTGGAVAGYLAPGIRGRHLATMGALGALTFLFFSMLLPVKMFMELQLCVAFMLVLHPMITGTVAHWIRLHKDATDALQPRPWVSSRAAAEVRSAHEHF